LKPFRTGLRLREGGFTLPKQLGQKMTLEKEVLRKRDLLSRSSWQLLGFIGHTPTATFYTVFASGDQMDFHLSCALSNVVDCTLTVSLCFNPILYAFRSTTLEKALYA